MANEPNPYASPRAQPDELVATPKKRKVIEGLFLGFFGLVAAVLMVLIGVVFVIVRLYFPVTPRPSQETWMFLLIMEGALGFGAYLLLKGARRCFTQPKER